jgi:hypothetical protein
LFPRLARSQQTLNLQLNPWQSCPTGVDETDEDVEGNDAVGPF